LRRALRGIVVTLGITAVTLTAPAVTATAAAPTPLIGATVANVTPVAGSTVGVGAPITVTFTGPVANRAAVQGSIRVIEPDDTAGTFQWLSDEVVQFKPDTFWPAHSDVKLMVGNMPLSFDIGSSVVGVASISNHTFTVTVDGGEPRQMPASMGKPKHPTPVGSFTALGKENPVVMDSRTIGIPLDDPEGYKLTVNYAVRVTWGGVYVHSAPWSVGSQGYANVSHGCINLSPDNAAWYYNQVSIGDPIIINA
jgi:lipoprotein-anchoring transpeptidase ErfK/SrfK